MSHKHYLTGISPRKQQSCPGGSSLELKRESWRVNGRVVDDDYSCKSALHLINQIPATSLSDFGTTNHGSQKHPKTSGLCLFLRLRQQSRLSTASLDAFKKQSKTNVALCISGKVKKCLVSVSCLARSCLKEISVPSSQTSKHQKHIMIYIDFPCFPKFLPHPTSPNHIKWSSCYNFIGFWSMVLWQKTSPSSRSLNKLRVNWPQVSLWRSSGAKSHVARFSFQAVKGSNRKRTRKRRNPAGSRMAMCLKI